ncbi:MAG TPA: MBL fold metallo-hydrolase [Pyrinomonadaceae bacterium]|nr:MBL fold metallo-hydrolase [Pyrinomonadaceae bacterium]
MIIETFITTAFQQNTRVLACAETRRAICVDPGAGADLIAGYLNENDLQLQAVALTHAHLDHIGGTTGLHKSFPQVEIVLHRDDEDLYYLLPQQPTALGIPRAAWANLGFEYENPPEITRNWRDGELYEVGKLRFKALHCPGHTRGHVVLFEENERKVFVGDCLFAGSIGRTDLPGGSFEQLMDSITNKILTLGDDVTVYSGHGPETTVGYEKRTNPFLTGHYQFGRGRYI